MAIEIQMRNSNNDNIISHNQYSNQNLITNNKRNNLLLTHNDKVNNNEKINCKLIKNKNPNQLEHNEGSGTLLDSNFNSVKNFVDYNEYFFNVFRIEIFESKLNLIKRNKIIEHKQTEDLNIIKELNNEEFQQNFLTKYMDSNSSGINSFEGYENNFTDNIYNSKSINKLRTNTNSKKYGMKTNRKVSMGTPISHEDIDSETEAYYKKLNGMIPDSSPGDSCGNNIKLKNLTTERDNSVNFNTYINSETPERFKFSHKDLTGLNISNIKHENRENVNSSSTNNNEKKLTLKENNLSNSNNHINYHSNTNRGRIQNDSLKRLSRASYTLNDSIASNKFNYQRENSEGIYHRDFIVTDEKDFRNNESFKFSNQSQMLSSGNFILYIINFYKTIILHLFSTFKTRSIYFCSTLFIHFKFL